MNNVPELANSSLTYRYANEVHIQLIRLFDILLVLVLKWKRCNYYGCIVATMHMNVHMYTYLRTCTYTCEHVYTHYDQLLCNWHVHMHGGMCIIMLHLPRNGVANGCNNNALQCKTR